MRGWGKGNLLFFISNEAGERKTQKRKKGTSFSRPLRGRSLSGVRFKPRFSTAYESFI
jgi:hypothetical protein